MTSSIRIIGTGLTRFGRFDDISAVDLAVEAAVDSIEASGLAPREIQAAFFGSVGEVALGQRAMTRLGLGGIPIVNVQNACASSSTAFYLAQLALRADEYESVLVVGAHSYASSRQGGMVPSHDDDSVEAAAGLTLPGLYALIARRHMYEYGTTPEQLALVSVKNHQHGLSNSRAYFRSALSVEQVLESRLIADPLTLWQCCARTDGAAALVMTTAKGAVGPRLRASVLRAGAVTGSANERSWGVELVAAAAAEAWQRSGVAPTDVDVFEVHDAFTIGELVSYESMGLCAPGESGKLIEERTTWLGGRHVVNPSGGLLARGHPVSATGLAMLVEITEQLMGMAGQHQVLGARLGVAETMGGGTSGISGDACTVTVLESP